MVNSMIQSDKTRAGDARLTDVEAPVDISDDPLDMTRYQLNRLPKKIVSEFEKWLMRAGSVLAVAVFIFVKYVIDPSFLHQIDPAILGKSARALYDSAGAELFAAHNLSMLAVFLASIILWITEAIPNYLTSLILIVTLVLTGVLPEETAYHQLGHEVMWLNILSFVLASMLVTTGAARRFALWFIIKFGKNATSIFLSFLIINLILSAFISATTAKAAILLPIFMVIAAIYGATGGANRNNFGRNIVLQNLFQINVGASAFLTGSGANLLAAALIGGAIGSNIFYTDWLLLAFPIALCLLLIGWVVGTRILFPLKPEEQTPQIEGGMDRLRQEITKMGKIKVTEIKSIIIFVTVLVLWFTDRWHGVSATAVAFLGAIVSLLPGVGAVKWNDVNIPWHLLLFSAGAYTLGAGFKQTDLPAILVDAVFDHLGLGTGTPFWVLYLILTGTMLFSAIIFQSKTMRTLIFIPIAIGVAQKFGYPVLSLAFPTAMLIEHVYTLPFNSKPAALLYITDHYSWSDTFKFGLTMMFFAWGLIILMAVTFFKYMGITPNGLGIF